MQNLRVSLGLFILATSKIVYFSARRSELRDAHQISYKKVQTDFLGNSTAIRKHICRNFKNHFIPYWKACDEKGIPFYDRYLSEEDRKRFACIKNNDDPTQVYVHLTTIQHHNILISMSYQ